MLQASAAKRGHFPEHQPCSRRAATIAKSGPQIQRRVACGQGSPGLSKPAADDLDRAVKRHGCRGHCCGSLSEPSDEEEELVDRDVLGDCAVVLRPRQDAADGGLDLAGGFLHGRRKLAALADERDQSELR